MGSLTKEIQKARIDCFLFFFIVQFGWGKTVVLPSGAKVAVDAPASGMRRLGYPNRYRLWTASKRVRETCPMEAAQYKQSWKEWQEARRRYLATDNESSWQWYVCGKGNSNSVSYRTKVDLCHNGGEQHFRTRRGFKYMANELLPRQEERQRALREMRSTAVLMQGLRERIFDLMGVPEEYRSLA